MIGNAGVTKFVLKRLLNEIMIIPDFHYIGLEFLFSGIGF